MFIGWNENGEVVLWRLTKTTAFREIEDLLQELKGRLSLQGGSPQMVVVDDCCAVKASYRKVFPETVVKLDLYHACQRFVKTLPKGLPKSQQLSKEFGLIFRANGDTGPDRGMETPDVETIESSLEMFLKKWESQLSSASIDSIRNLRKHIRKGCCSAIPVGSGTQRNERLHKSLKRSLLGGASTLSPELAVAVFAIVLYVWNCKRDPDARQHCSNARVFPVVPIELRGTFINNSNAARRELVFKCDSSTSTELSSGVTQHSDTGYVIHTEKGSARDDFNLKSDMNKECLHRNLASSGLAVDPVAGNGDCCFSSIVKQLHKVILSKDEEGNTELVSHLRELGFQTSIIDDTSLLRSLFCKEIEKISMPTRTG